MGFMKGQQPECALELLGHPNGAFVPDKHSRDIPGLDGGEDPVEETLS